MQNHRNEAIRSPFSERDCWPVTGPVYGFREDDIPPRARAWFWERWLFREEEDEKPVKSGPISPIHY